MNVKRLNRTNMGYLLKRQIGRQMDRSTNSLMVNLFGTYY